ncbi:hypothetical protein C1708_30960 [Streptomyces sp. DH-12]|nr:hemerythrin domain-containing protein [Streptomyces sp. DH-12]PNV36189.1 hypothetical protein C1708_30960 [Streptomyces sp. DH-12]
MFPALAEGLPDRIAALEAEHRRTGSAPAEAADGTAPADPAWPGRLMAATAVLRDHILKEQDGVFPTTSSGRVPRRDRTVRSACHRARPA